MDKIATENLFLLEFLVDKVDLDPSCDCGEVEGEKCVSFQFLDNAPLDVCEADFNPQRNYKSNCPKDTNLKSGKSCLFSLSPEQAEDAINKLDIYVLIYKKMPPDNWGSENIEIGSALISISNLFEELIDCITTSTGEESSSPTAKTLKDDFDISTSSGDICGKIGVYIRLSCFGKLIVTQFQMNLQDKSVLFKDKEGKSLYRYKKAGKGKNGGDKKCTPRNNRINGNGGQNYNESCPTTPCGGDARGSQPRNSLNSQRMSGDFPITPSNSPMDPFDNSGKACVDNCPKKPCLANQNGRGSGVGSYGGPPGFNVGGGQFNGGGVGCNVGQGGPMGFPGMGMGGGPGMGMGGGPGMGMGGGPGMGMGGGPGMGMNGGPGMGMNGGPGMGMNGGPGMMRQAPCLECGNIPNAACLPPAQFGGFPGGFGNGMPPGGFGNGMPPGSMGQPCSECSPCPMADDSKSDPEGNYHEIGASMGGNSLTIRVHKDNKVETVDDDETASCICKNSKNNNMNLNIQPGVQQAGKDLPFSFRMGQQGQGQGGGVVVNPPTCTAANGAKVTEFSDPNKELFVLRIGKKSEGVDKKQNLELELCTPKGPELKPIPQKKSTDTQYDPADAGPESKKGKGKGKGKKKK